MKVFNGVGVYNLVYIGGYRGWISEIFGFQSGKVLKKMKTSTLWIRKTGTQVMT